MRFVPQKLIDKYKKISKKRLFVFVALFLTVTIISWAFLSAFVITKNFNRSQIFGSENRQELDVSSVVLVETKDDQKFWEIYAKSGSYDSDNKVAMLNTVVGNFYQDNEVSMSFESTRGTYNEIKQQIILYDKTHIVIKDGTSLFCDTFIWSGSDKDIILEGNVRIERDNQFIAQADKGIISSDYSKFKIVGNSVTKLYEAKEKK